MRGIDILLMQLHSHAAHLLKGLHVLSADSHAPQLWTGCLLLRGPQLWECILHPPRASAAPAWQAMRGVYQQSGNMTT